MKFTKILTYLFFFLSLIIIGLVAGGFLGAKFVPKDAGLASGAMVLGYALMGVLASLVIGGILAWKLPPDSFKRAFQVVGALGLGALGLIGYRFFTEVKPQIEKQKAESMKNLTRTKPSAPAAAVDVGRPPSGIGMVKPMFFPAKPLYFFKEPNAAQAVDSLVFKTGEHFMEVAQAPADFEPEYQKLDYDLFFLRAMSQQGEWLEVVTNRTADRTFWVKKDDVVWRPWSAFIPNVYSIEHLRPQDFPVREEPMNHAPPLDAQPAEPWQVERVDGDWLKLKKSGWLRWRQDGRQMVRFVYLS